MEQNNMSPFPWENKEDGIYPAGKEWQIISSDDVSHSDRAGIVLAINNTYGASINPEAVPDLFEALKGLDAIWGKEWGYDKHPAFLKAKEAIEKAKLYPLLIILTMDRSKVQITPNHHLPAYPFKDNAGNEY